MPVVRSPQRRVVMVNPWRRPRPPVSAVGMATTVIAPPLPAMPAVVATPVAITTMVAAAVSIAIGEDDPGARRPGRLRQRGRDSGSHGQGRKGPDCY